MNLSAYLDRNTSPQLLPTADALGWVDSIYLYMYYEHKFITKTKYRDGSNPEPNFLQIKQSALYYRSCSNTRNRKRARDGVNVVTCVDSLINFSLLERETLQYLLRQTSPLNLAAHAVRMCRISLIQSWSHCALSSELCMNPTWVKY